ncbi:MAG: TIR domain-containing protein [Lachnospiraceae bacterium]|nr:TIR domain-containing protein [Lachnospiraceae bacterium]
MTIIRCKMCGGNLSFKEGATVCECEYCGSWQTIPTVNNEKKMKLFERANRLRLNCEFDKAASVYESIIEEFPEEAEGYWGNLLCKYGIEYVDDPIDGSKVPTCHRSSFDSVMDDPDFEIVMEYADVIARSIYREQAKQLEELRKGIVAVSANEQPYDIFNCYKETAEDGQRTIDSVIAQDVYDTLTAKDYRVFFSRISLEDKLGTEYEPYIFAALNSAKVMLAFGTRYDYYNAVWVKNEWSRYLRIMAKDKTKHLIPCYKDIDAYDIPKEFAKLQAQDMGKVGAVQDLIRGIDKLMGRDVASQKQSIIQQVGVGGPNASALLDRGNLALEDGKFEDACRYFDQVLSMDARCAEAYLGMAMAATYSHNLEEYGEKIAEGTQVDINFNRAKQFASLTLRDKLESFEEENVLRLKKLWEEKVRKQAEEEKARTAIAEQKAKIKDEVEEIKAKIASIESGNYALSSEDEQEYERLKQQTEAEKKAYEKASAELVGMPERTEEVRLKKEIEKKNIQIAGLGIFKAKEKKTLQVEIEELERAREKATLAVKMKSQSVEQLKTKYLEAKTKEDTFFDSKFAEARNSLMQKVTPMLLAIADEGDAVPFGHYWTRENEEDWISWIVLKQYEKRLLLISE